jgi:hypothetical protein
MGRRTVEECLVLDVVRLARDGLLSPGRNTRLRWRRGEAVIARVHLTAQADTVTLPLLHTEYAKSLAHPSVALEHTVTAFGAERVWLSCPRCRTPRRKLYLPPGETLFLCRICHDLTYESRQRRGDTYAAEALGRRLERLQQQAWHLAQEGEARRRREEEARVLLGGLADEGKGAGGDPPPTPKRPRGRPRIPRRPYVRTRPFLLGERGSPSERLCMRCRDFREIRDPKPVTLPNGRPALAGSCPVCGARIMAIVKKDGCPAAE